MKPTLKGKQSDEGTLAEMLPKEIGCIRNHQTELPRIARDPKLMAAVEMVLRQMPTYHELLLKLIRERLYDSACFLLSSRKDGQRGRYSETCQELTFERFVTALTAQALACAQAASKEPRGYPTMPE